MISIADPNARKDLGEQLSETVETLTIPNIQIIPHVLTQRSKILLFDHLVGKRDQRRRNFDAESIGGLHSLAPARVTGQVRQSSPLARLRSFVPRPLVNQLAIGASTT